MTKEEAKLVLDNARPQTKEIDRQFYDDEDLNKALDLAIKSLEQQPCDCVSREAVLDLMQLKIGGKELYKAVYDLPPVTPTQSWIPVSEELPKDRDWYLGIFREHDTGWINPLPFVCDYVGKETKATTKEFWILRGFTDIDIPCDYYKNLECVAWMPLPQPILSPQPIL